MDSFEYSETFGARIRQFFQELFGSRLVAHLEEELLIVRNDFETRLHDKDIIISGLREEKALLNSKITVYENTVMSHTSRMGAEVVAYQKTSIPKPNFSFVDIAPTKTRWQLAQEQHEEQMRKELEEEEKSKAASSS